MKGGPGGNDIPRMGPFSSASRAAVKDVIAQLTPVQAEVWRALSGPDFDIEKLINERGPDNMRR